MDGSGAWSGVGVAVLSLSGLAAVSIFTTDASHSSWELGLASLFALLAAFGLYWMIAALVGRWPFNKTTPETVDQPPKRIGVVNRRGGVIYSRGAKYGEGLDTGVDNAGEYHTEYPEHQ